MAAGKEPISKKRKPEAKAAKVIQTPPFETKELNSQLSEFYNHEWTDPKTNTKHKVGDCQWGAYAFYDYDDEPIYVGQTSNTLRDRIGRHLTGKRSDAVGKFVLDPYEVCYIEVYLLPDLQGVAASNKEAKARLKSLEYKVYEKLKGTSKFGAVLNEEEPKNSNENEPLPEPYKRKVVTEKVEEFRNHPDIRLSRRASIVAKLAQLISERELKRQGLRKTFFVQIGRLQWLAEKRLGDFVKKKVKKDTE